MFLSVDLREEIASDMKG